MLGLADEREKVPEGFRPRPLLHTAPGTAERSPPNQRQLVTGAQSAR
jgi:hypothetical protein